MASRAAPVAKVRLENIDALRGLAMVLMLLDHLRETWMVYVPVADPMDARTAIPAMAFARFLVSFCAPIFVALTGLGVSPGIFDVMVALGRERTLSRIAAAEAYLS